ncbi:hypothetical protein [Acinetobacter haemolyticus]|uniref:hypothetical protein n=1 Tax=Acinetobacter haemolyticus TaxID=29430 RepID=UPI002DB81297|nr:hypothetical protein [Acinetobacter haemolyticus]MEB6676762.1 hypothetical protein [Acinetobacter haemolyticus]
MKTIVYGVVSFIFLFFIILVVAYSQNFNVLLDILFTQLASFFVAFFIAILGVMKGVKIDQASLMLFIAQISALLGWVFAMVILSGFQVSIYSTTALVFDLLLGAIVSITICFYMFDKFLTINKIDNNS